jgi:hypothetical protein
MAALSCFHIPDPHYSIPVSRSKLVSSRRIRDGKNPFVMACEGFAAGSSLDIPELHSAVITCGSKLIASW